MSWSWSDTCECGHSRVEHQRGSEQWERVSADSFDAECMHKFSALNGRGCTCSVFQLPPPPATYDYDVILVRTGTMQIVPDSTLVLNPCGNCGHGFLKHVEHGEVHCGPIEHTLTGIRWCACAGWTPKYQLVGRHR